MTGIFSARAMKVSTARLPVAKRTESSRAGKPGGAENPPPIFQGPEIERGVDVQAAEIPGDVGKRAGAGEAVLDLSGRENAGGPGGAGVAGGEEN
jgi:hypothetical protein